MECIEHGMHVLITKPPVKTLVRRQLLQPALDYSRRPSSVPCHLICCRMLHVCRCAPTNRSHGQPQEEHRALLAAAEKHGVLVQVSAKHLTQPHPPPIEVTATRLVGWLTARVGWAAAHRLRSTRDSTRFTPTPATASRSAHQPTSLQDLAGGQGNGRDGGCSGSAWGGGCGGGGLRGPRRLVRPGLGAVLALHLVHVPAKDSARDL